MGCLSSKEVEAIEEDDDVSVDEKDLTSSTDVLLRIDHLETKTGNGAIGISIKQRLPADRVPLPADRIECSTGHGCVYAKAASQEIQNRKVLYGLQGKEVVFKSSVDRPTSSGNNGGNLVGWELRKVPSGPDPLHHNGGGPKKPKTP
ncbi:hypothetical protein F0562_022393 [Nyssa sinensis]|uniref:Uncharacterized protein n=1 Tax=Nyssa sinensis TaxID=561372 RepID=A0A5J5BNE7_9ASTE|nr:hypothetical protein F0562_022393 [Nyssa sinensis]